MLELELAPILENLRDEIEAAIIDARDQDVVFEVKNIDIELKLAITTGGSGKGGFKFYVVDFEAGASISREKIHSIKFSITPKFKKDGVEDANTARAVEIANQTRTE